MQLRIDDAPAARLAALARSGGGLVGDLQIADLRRILDELERLRAVYAAVRPWALAGEVPDTVAKAVHQAER